MVVVDIGSRYIDAEPLSKKDAVSVKKAFEKIFSRKLVYSYALMVDQDSEFEATVSQLMIDHNVHIQRGEPKNHRAQAFVERANRTLAERIYSHQYAQLLFKGDETWKRRLREVIQAINNEPRRIFANKTPIDVVGEDKVKIKTNVSYKRPVGVLEERLPPGVLVRYLYAPGENEGGDRRRATDPIWSIEVYNLDRTIVRDDQPVLYYLAKSSSKKQPPRRGFVREELPVIPEDTELPPDHVLARRLSSS